MEKFENDESYICDNCGDKVDPARNICLQCGDFYDPLQRMFAEKSMAAGDGYSAWLSVSQEFKVIDSNYKFNEGLKLLGKMSLPAAIEYYNEILKNVPRQIELWNNLGVAYMGRKNRKEALICYEQALQINPKYYIGLYNKGAVYFNCKRYADAISFFERALKINPKCGEAYWDRHIANQELGKSENEASLEAMKQGLNLFRAQKNLSSALIDLGNGNDAILGHYKYFLKNIAQIRKYAKIAFDHMKNKKISKALENFDKGLTINPKDTVLLFGKSRAMFMVKRYDEALRFAGETVENNPDLEDAWLIMGTIYSMRSNFDEDFDETLRCYEQILRINPFNKFAIQGKEELSRFAVKDLKVEEVQEILMSFRENPEELLVKCPGCGTIAFPPGNFCKKCGTPLR